MIRVALPMALLLLAGCADQAGMSQHEAAERARETAEINDALKGLTPGDAKGCIDQTRVRNVQKFAHTILYQYSPREIYRTDVTDGCPGLRYGDIIVSRTVGTQLCRGDIIHTVSPGPGGPTGVCALGSFVPYRR